MPEMEMNFKILGVVVQFVKARTLTTNKVILEQRAATSQSET
jgi:hypothetical protein